MKTIALCLAAIIFMPAISFAKKIKCANLDYSAEAEISEIYLDVILIRRLHKVEINKYTVYKSWLGRIDHSNPFEKNGHFIDMFSGGVLIESGAEIYKLACGAPKDFNPESSAHQEFVGNWHYLFTPAGS